MFIFNIIVCHTYILEYEYERKKKVAKSLYYVGEA